MLTSESIVLAHHLTLRQEVSHANILKCVCEMCALLLFASLFTHQLIPICFSTLRMPFSSFHPMTPQNGQIYPICISMVTFAHLSITNPFHFILKPFMCLSPSPRHWKFLGTETLEVYCYIFKDKHKM